MIVAPWHISNWTSVSICPSQVDATSASYRLLGVSADAGPSDGLMRGHVVYGCAAESGCAAMAWEWAEMKPRVIAMSDPMTIISNIRLQQDQGEVDDDERLLFLHGLIGRVDWQAEVREVLAWRRRSGTRVVKADLPANQAFAPRQQARA